MFFCIQNAKKNIPGDFILLLLLFYLYLLITLFLFFWESPTNIIFEVLPRTAILLC